MADHINLTAAEQAAAQIVALINSSPRSPRQDEIAAVIANAMGSSSPEPITPMPRMAELRAAIAALEAAPHRALWNEGVAKANAAWAKLHALDEAGEDNVTVDAAGEEAADIDDALDDVARHIWREGSADIMLLGEICYRVMWMANLTDEDAPEQLASGPAFGFGDGGDCIRVQALANLLGAVRQISRGGGNPAASLMVS
jgi:hypothetical protein